MPLPVCGCWFQTDDNLGIKATLWCGEVPFMPKSFYCMVCAANGAPGGKHATHTSLSAPFMDGHCFIPKTAMTMAMTVCFSEHYHAQKVLRLPHQHNMTFIAWCMKEKK